MKGKHSQSKPYEGGNKHRVKGKLRKIFFYEKGKISITMSEKCKDEKMPLGFSKFKFELGNSRGKLMCKIYSN